MNSNIKNIFYLIEGRTSQNAVLPQSTVDSAILNTQIVSNFKVRQTQSLQETIRLITEMNQAIETKYMQEFSNQDSEYINFKYKFEEYQLVVSKSKGLTSKILFGNMLRTIKGCGREFVSQVLDKFDTIHEFYHALKAMENETERLEFLGIVKKTKGGKGSKKLMMEEPSGLRLNKTVANHIVKLFFENPYPKIVDKKALDINEEGL